MSKEEKTCRCYVDYDKKSGSELRPRGYTATAWEEPPGSNNYVFYYGNLVNLNTYDSFIKDITHTLDAQTTVKLEVPHMLSVCSIPSYEMVPRINSPCTLCDLNTPYCTYVESLENTWKINLILLAIQTCPHCGSSLKERRKLSPPATKTIHDIRMAGHPAHLNIIQNKHWRCDNCEKNISTIRIPSIQHIVRGKFTLRLLRSIFELSINKVPLGFIAEGYDLKQRYVGQLCRDYIKRTKDAYLTHLTNTLLELPINSLYDEPIFLNGTEYRAIFSSDKKTFYAVLPASRIRRVLHFLKSDNRGPTPQSPPVMAYALSTLPPIRRRIAYELMCIVSDALFDFHYPPYPDLYLDEIHVWFTAVLERDKLNLNDLLADLHSFNDFFDYHPQEENNNMPLRSIKRASELAAFIQQILDRKTSDSNLNNLWDNGNLRISKFGEFYDSLHSKQNCQRIPVTISIEEAFNNSKYPFSEKLNRLQFYNEVSLLSNQENGIYQTPPLDVKDGMPQLEKSRIGRGFPVACLEQLLRTGLLDPDSNEPIQCFTQRQRGNSKCCTLDCPFLK